MKKVSKCGVCVCVLEDVIGSWVRNRDWGVNLEVLDILKEV